MAALTESQDYQVKGPVVILDIEAAGNYTYLKGALLVTDTNGYANAPSDAANLPPLGVYTGRQGQAFAVPGSLHPKMEIETGLIWIAHAGAAQANTGKLFYLTDDGTVSETAGAKNWAVMCRGWKAGFVLLDFAHPYKTA